MTDTPPPASLTTQGQKYAMARPGNKCQQRKPGCTTTASTLQVAYPTILLGKWGRDANYADQWFAVCPSCAAHPNLGS